MPSTSKKTTERVIKLRESQFIVYEVLREYWNLCRKNEESPTLSNRDVTRMMEEKFPDSEENKSPSFFWNTMKKLVGEGIIRELPREAARGVGSIVMFDPDWEVLEKCEVILIPGSENQKLNSYRPPSSSGKPQKIGLGMMRALPNKTTAQEDPDCDWSKVISKSCTLEAKDFEGSTSKTAVRSMFSGEGKLEIIIKNGAVSIIAHEPMDCKLGKKAEMENGKEYPINPANPHFLIIDDVEYVIRSERL